MRRNRDARDRREREAAQAIADQLERRTIPIKARAGEGGRLFGSVTSSDIAAAVQTQIGVEVDRRHIALDEPLKELGGVRPAGSAAPRRDRQPSRRGRRAADRAVDPRLSTGSSTGLLSHERPVDNVDAASTVSAVTVSHPPVHNPQGCGRTTRVVHRKVTRLFL